MAEFSITRHPTYEEVRVEGVMSLAMVREIVGELAKAEDFHRRHVLWNFGLDVHPLAFHEFDNVIGMLEKVYARGTVRDKKVALVAQGPFARSVATVFKEQARSLPVSLRVFDELETARGWIEG